MDDLNVPGAQFDAAIARAEAAEDKATQNWIEVERLDEELARAEAYIERIRQAMGGYRDSDLASLAETLNARNAALEAENASLREQVARLTAELADCQRERTRNADAAARAIDELTGG